jgi:hypothetical protein
MVGVVLTGGVLVDEPEPPQAAMQIETTSREEKIEIFSTMKPLSFIENGLS